MIEEKFCERHGPYDPSLSQCPYCTTGDDLPPPPPPLDDELPTDPWSGRGQSARIAADDEETDFGFYAQLHDEEEQVTQWPERWLPDWDKDETSVEEAAPGLIGFLIVKQGMRRGQVYRVRHGSTIGRDRAKIIVRDPRVSRPHAKLTIEEDQFVLWDFGSENGTFVNGERIRGATVLDENDTVRIGDTVFVLKILK